MTKEYIAVLEDALDHIARVAGMARRPTRRLDWIVARARLALKGEPFAMDKLPQYPKDGTRLTRKESTAQFVAGLRRAAEIAKENSDNGEVFDVVNEIIAEATRIESEKE